MRFPRRCAITALAILVGMVLGCWFECPKDDICGVIENGSYRVEETSFDMGEVIDGRAVIDDGHVRIDYFRPDGSEWAVTYRRE